MKRVALILCLAFMYIWGNISAQNTNQKEYKATFFGVKSDGIVDNTYSIQRAIDFISENGGGTLVFYVGRYLTGGFELKSNVRIKISSGAVLVCVPNVYAYKGDDKQKALIYAKDQENIGVEGVGTIDGTGFLLGNFAADQKLKGYISNEQAVLPAMIYFDNCKNVVVEQNTFQNFKSVAQVYKKCRNISLEKLYVFNKEFDASALSLSECQNLTVNNCYWDTKVSPIISDGTSADLKFTKSINPKGKQVSVTK